MRRLLRILMIVPLALAGLVGGVWLAANTDPGRRVIEQAVAGLTGGTVRLEGLHGTFPQRLRLARLEIHDRDGAWLVADDVALDWHPLALVDSVMRGDRLVVGRLAVRRTPVSEGGAGETVLPVRIVMPDVRIERLELSPALTMLPGVLAVSAAGRLDLRALNDATVALAAQGLAKPGTLTLDGTLSPDALAAKIEYKEPAEGLLAALADLPGLGDTAMTADLRGPWAALAAKLSLTAGPLRAEASATLDLPGQRLVADVSAEAPAMALSLDLAWRAVAVKLHAEGPFAAPKLDGTVRVESLRAGGADVALLAAEAHGDAGQVAATARAEGLVLPGPYPRLLATAPLVLEMTANLAAPDYPTTVRLAHPRIGVAGTVRAGEVPAADLEVTLPDLGGLLPDIAGKARAQVEARLPASGAVLGVTGSVALSAAPTPQLVGTVDFDLAAEQRGERLLLERLSLATPLATLSANGAWGPAGMEADLSLVLADLERALPALRGQAQVSATLRGSVDDLALEAQVTGMAGTEGFAPLPLSFGLTASGLPSAPVARLEGHATLEGAPLAVRATAERQPGGALRLRVEEASWKSARAVAALALAQGAVLPTGTARVEVARLEDAAPFAPGLSGSLTAEMEREEAGVLTARAEAKGIGALREAVLTAVGPPESVALKLSAQASGAMMEAGGTLDAVGRVLTLASLRANQGELAAALQAPARISFGDGLAVDRLRLSLSPGGGVLDVSGRVAPALELNATLRGVPAAALAGLAGGPAVDGNIEGEARITGETTAPQGRVRVAATGLRLREGPAATLPPANLTVTATLNGPRAQLDAQVTLGTTKVTVAGGVPLGAGPLELRANGRASLAMLDPILTAEGRSLRGDVALDGTVGGTLASPVLGGTLRLSRGEARDAGSGLLIRDINGLVRGEGARVVVERLEGKAGNGTIGLTGSATLAPVPDIDLRLRASNARPLTSPLVTAVVDADLALRGAVGGAMRASGEVKLNRVEIRIPEKLPVTLPTLPIRVAGQAPPAPSPPVEPSADIALDVTVRAPGNVFVRGRGLDAELQGQVHVGGTAAAPAPDGGLQLRRGSFNLLGRALTLTTGTVTLAGGTKLDPQIDFVATNKTSAMTAKVQVVGSASAPEIKLSSEPEMPPDEILAQLLLGRSINQLSPAQIAEIAVGLAQITGRDGGFDPLGRIRAELGLDRLSVGSNAEGKATLEAGRNLAPGVYLGVKQGAGGSGTQATVEIDLGRGLKVWGEVGTSSGGTSATGAAGGGGSGVGIGWSREY